MNADYYFREIFMHNIVCSYDVMHHETLPTTPLDTMNSILFEL